MVAVVVVVIGNKRSTRYNLRTECILAVVVKMVVVVVVVVMETCERPTKSPFKIKGVTRGPDIYSTQG